MSSVCLKTPLGHRGRSWDQKEFFNPIDLMLTTFWSINSENVAALHNFFPGNLVYAVAQPSSTWLPPPKWKVKNAFESVNKAWAKFWLEIQVNVYHSCYEWPEIWKISFVCHSSLCMLMDFFTHINLLNSEPCILFITLLYGIGHVYSNYIFRLFWFSLFITSLLF